ncbi:E3 SUMO-protein ligase SIZ1-like [Humulus lupulus]|uniref:E3 SUMO-protein ligase SIZ1-like n=1 Tax=Humulus lupulus TaxID=3486 RepID=UPI002B4082A2|nr:E3 SUMO-protein ligase SIZ1-like [Humulus lupulus]
MQDLVDRILVVLSDDQVSKLWAKKNAVGKEQVAQLVDDIYRKMQVSAAPDLASKGQGVSDSSNVKVKGEIDDHSFQSETKVRCFCGISSEKESMINVFATHFVFVPLNVAYVPLNVAYVFYCVFKYI